MEGDFWELDISTPKTIEATARPLPQSPLPLGLSRGTRLSRPRQIDFFQRFMAVPFVPSFSAPNFSLQRVLAIPFSNNWYGNHFFSIILSILVLFYLYVFAHVICRFTSLLGQFNLHKFVSSVKDPNSKSTLLQALRDKSLYAFGFFSEFLLTPDDTLLVIFDSYVHNDTTRKKAVYHHKASLFLSS